MAKTAWITPAELEAHLTGLGVTVPTGTDLQSEIDGAVEALDEACGGLFLEGVETEFPYSPPYTHTLVLSRYFTVITNVHQNGVTIPAASYQLKPLNGPFTRIEFNTIKTGDVPIYVEGNPGKSSTIPERVWNAVRDYAAAAVYEKAFAAGAVTGPATEVKQGGFSVKFGGATTMPAYHAELRKNALKVFKKEGLPTISRNEL